MNGEAGELPVGELVEPASVPSAVSTDRLEGRHVVVRRLDPDRDCGDLYRGSHGDPTRERLWTYMGYGPFPSEDQFHAWLQQQASCHDPRFFTVLAAGRPIGTAAGRPIGTATGRPIGMAAMLNIELEMRRVELGHIWYVPEAQRTTANTETAFLLLGEAFERYHCRRVEWKCDALNAASRGAATRLGFRFEGVFRNHMIVKGRNRDTAWYAMTDAEWATARPILEGWLEAAPSRRRPLGEVMETAFRSRAR